MHGGTKASDSLFVMGTKGSTQDVLGEASAAGCYTRHQGLGMRPGS